MSLPRSLAPLALLIVAALAVTSCQSTTVADRDIPTPYSIEQAPADEMPAEVQEILDSGRLTIGNKFDQPLTGLQDEATGRVEGFDAEIGRIIAQRIFGSGNVAEGENLDFIETISDNRESYLEKSVVDLVVGTYTINDDRESQVDFAGPYYEAGQSFMTLKADKIREVSQLSDKKVCAAEGSTSVDNIKKENPKAEETTMRDYSSCVKALLDKEVDAVSTDDAILHGYAYEDPDRLTVSKETFSVEAYGVGMPNESEDLRRFINETLVEAFDNGDWKLAFDRTLGSADIAEPEDVPEINA